MVHDPAKRQHGTLGFTCRTPGVLNQQNVIRGQFALLKFRTRIGGDLQVGLAGD